MEIIAVDDDPILLHTIKMVLENDFGEIITLNHPSLLESHLNKHAIKVIILDLNFAIGSSDGVEGMAWIPRIKDKWPHISIIILTAHGFVNVAVKSLKLGATDFVEKPFANEKLVATVKTAYNLSQSQSRLKEALSEKKVLVDQLNRSELHIAGSSKPMMKIYDTIDKVASTDASVLIIGEHGTGKEVMARFIHQESNRASEPFVHVDLSAISEGLFESTLFGHARGAFTDAAEDKPGLLEMANFGTLFMDGIGDVPLHLQSKLLSALQNREITRVGEATPRAIDIRLISATHLSENLLASGESFRQDLFFRINTVVINIPPLRNRINDIKPFVEHFLNYFNRKYERQLTLNKDELESLKAHSWPGNIRELKNSLERMVIMGHSSENILNIEKHKKPKSENLYDLERDKIAEIIEKHSGNMSRAAQELGIGRNTLYRKMKKYDL